MNNENGDTLNLFDNFVNTKDYFKYIISVCRRVKGGIFDVLPSLIDFDLIEIRNISGKFPQWQKIKMKHDISPRVRVQLLKELGYSVRASASIVYKSKSFVERWRARSGIQKTSRFRISCKTNPRCVSSN